MGAFKSDPWGPQPAQIGSGYASTPAVVPASAGGSAGGLMDPATTLALIQGGSQVLGSALGGNKSGQPAQSSASGYTSASFDNSGWSVATGQGKATTSGALPWGWILIAGVVGLLIWKRA